MSIGLGIFLAAIIISLTLVYLNNRRRVLTNPTNRSFKVSIGLEIHSLEQSKGFGAIGAKRQLRLNKIDFFSFPPFLLGMKVNIYNRYDARRYSKALNQSRIVSDVQISEDLIYVGLAPVLLNASEIDEERKFLVENEGWHEVCDTEYDK